nr:PREDICTED: neuroblast differentiation-associated protein AHNAK [Latimeria chalumnae]|eukprot:XP_014354149.1 PREDICTED: neuroblast differentiation-associated protein AHNAK [Latimeria chalumnae]
MEKKEVTREILLPDWAGTGSQGITIDTNEEGVFVKEVQKDSPAAQIADVKKGDQVVSATIYFDNMSSEEIAQLMQAMGHHTVGLRLQRKGDKSPTHRLSWSQERSGATSPDIVLSGDDEDYRRIYTKKIKPRLKSEELMETEHSETQSRTITVTRKVTAYTVDVTGTEGGKDIDVSSPEFKIKIPRREETGLTKMDVEMEQGKKMIKIPQVVMSGKPVEMSDISVDLKGKHSGFSASGPKVDATKKTLDFSSSGVSSSVSELETSRIRVSGPQIKTPNVDVNLKAPKAEGDITAPKVDFKMSKVSTNIQVPDVDVETAGSQSIKIKMPGSTISGAKFQGPDAKVDLDIPKTGVHAKDPKLDGSVKISTTGFQIDATDLKYKGADGRPTRKIEMPTQVVTGPKLPSVDVKQKGKAVDISVAGPKLEHDVSTPKFTVITSKENVKAPEVSIFGKRVDKFTPKTTNVDISVPNVKDHNVDIKFTKPDGKTSGTKLTGNIQDPKINISGPLIESDINDLKPKIDIQGSDGNTNLSKIKFSSPKFGIKGENERDDNINVNLQKSKIDVSGPKVDIQVPSVNLQGAEGEIKGPDFQLPSFGIKGQEMSTSAIDLGLSGKKIQGDVDISGPKVAIEKSKADIEGPDGKIHLPKISPPKFGFKVGKDGDADIDVNFPKGKVEVSGPKVDIQAPEVDVQGSEGQIKGPKFNLPSMGIKAPKFSTPKIGLDLSGPNVKGDVDLSCPKVDLDKPEGDIKGPDGKIQIPKLNPPKFGFRAGKAGDADIDVTLPKGEIDVSGPKVNIQAPEFDVEGPEGKIKGAKIKMPDFDISAPKFSGPDVGFKLSGPKMKRDGDVSVPKLDIDKPEVDIKGSDGKVHFPKMRVPKFGFGGGHDGDADIDVNVPKAQIDVSGPKVDIQAPGVDVQGPEGQMKGPKFNLPSMGIKAPKFSTPEIGLDLSGHKAKGHVDVSCPKVDLGKPEFQIKGPDGKIQIPKLNPPKFGFKAGKTGDADIDVTIPKAQIDVSGPKVDIQAPEVDVQGPEGQIKGPKFNLPSMGIKAPKFSTPEIGLDLSGHKLKGDVDVSGPQVDLEKPEVDIKGRDGKMNFPKINFPKFGFGGGNDGDANVDVNLPKGKIDVSGPKVDIQVPEADIQGPEGKVKGHKYKMPDFNISAPKFSAPDIDLGNDGDANIDVNLPKGKIDVSGPKVDIQAPEVDVQGPKGKVKGHKYKMPDFNISAPKFSAPDIGLNLSSPKAKGDVDVSCPEVDIDKPEGDIKGPDGKMHFPKMKLPKFGFGGGHDGDADIDINLPKGQIDVSGPKVDIEAAEFDVQGPEGKIKGPKFKMPSLDVHAPKFSGPDFGLNLSGPKAKVDVDVSCPEVDIDKPEGDIKGPDGKIIDVNLPKGQIDVSGPKVDIEAAEFDVQGPEGKIKGPKFKMPSLDIHAPKFSGPDFGLNLSGPNVKGDVDVSGPQVDLEKPEVNIKGPDGKMHFPKMKLPKFGFGGGHDGDADIDVNFPKGQIDVSGPKVDIQTPDIELQGLEGKIKGPKFKMPDFNINAPKFSGPEIGLNLSGPELQGDVDVSGPKVDLDAPDIDVHSPDGKMKLPKLKLPSFGISRGKGAGSNVDVNLPSVELSGHKFEAPDVGVKSPKLDIEASDVNVDIPDLNIEGSGGGIKIPKFKKPKFGLGIKGPAADADLSLTEGDLSVDSPDSSLEIKGKKGKFKMPKIHMTGPKVKGKKPEIDIGLKTPDADINIASPDANLKGDLNVKAPKVKKPFFGKLHFPDVEFDIKSPKFKGDVSPKAEGELKTPELDLSAPDLKDGLKSPDIDITESGVNVGLPDASLEGPEIKTKKSKIKLPKFNISVPKPKGPHADLDIKSPKMHLNVSGPKNGAEVNAPDLNINTSTPSIDLHGSNAKLKAPKFKDVNIKLPEANVDLGGPKIEGDIKVPKVDANLDAPDINIESLDGSSKGSKFKIPSVNLSGPKINVPELNLNLSGPKLKDGVDASADMKGSKIGIEGPDVDAAGPEGNFKLPHLKLPSFGISGPKVKGSDMDLDVSVPTADVDVSGPRTGGDVRVPGMDVNLEGSNAKVKGPHFKIPGLNISTPQISTPDMKVNLSRPKLKGGVDASADMEGPKVDIEGPDVDTAVPEGSFKLPQFKLPSFGISGPKVKGHDMDLDVSIPTADVDVSGPKIEGDVRVPGVNVDLEGSGAKVKGPNFKMAGANISGPQISTPDLGIDFSGPKLKEGVNASADVKCPEVDLEGTGIGVEGQRGQLKMPQFKLPTFGFSGSRSGETDIDIDGSGQKVKGHIKAPEADIHLGTPDISMGESDIKLKGSQFKVTSLNASGPHISSPDFDIDLKGSKLKGDFDVSARDVEAPGVNLNVGTPGITIGGTGMEFKGSQFSSPTLEMGGPKLYLKDPLGKVGLPKLKLPSFATPGPKLEGREVGVDVNVPETSVSVSGGKFGGDINVPGIDVKMPRVSGEVSVSEAELEGANVQVKKSKIKMPLFNFSRSKVKGDVRIKSPKGSVSASGSKVDLKGSKASLGSADLEAEGISPKAKSSTFDFSLFKSKKPRHRSSSLSEELSPPSSPHGTLEFEGGALSAEGGKSKGKHSRLKFGTFGGLGSKSKGSYEVTVSDKEAGKVQGSGVSLASRKSRLSSSSSNDSGTKGGFQFPKLELAVSKTKD